jgi:outer membrane protein TolC
MTTRTLSLALIFCSIAASAQEPLPFRRALELALAHSTELALTQADESRAYNSYREARNAYIPKATLGSDIGYAYGFPLSLEGSAPTIFNVTAQSTVWNPALREFTKAAKTEWGVTQTQSKDSRDQLIADTALLYIELNRWEERLPILQSEMKVAQDIEYAVGERIKAGVDSPVEATKARLTEAQMRVHMTEAEGAVDVLRTRLSQLTGVSANSIRTQRDSIPVLADETPAGDVPARVSESSLAVEMAQQNAVSKELRAKGEHKAFYPTADFATQYGVINSSLTNFEQFFVPGSFQSQNVTFGLVLRLPFLDMSQKARAAAADAEALRARKEAEQAKHKAALDAVKMQHNVQELLAARDVAQLRYELAENQLDAAHARMQAETATQREMQNAALEAAERSLDRINAEFQLQQAQVQLYRATGELQQWALATR